MSNHTDMIAYVAIKRHPGGGATFAYLPSLDIPLPRGWEWNVVDGEVDTEDVSEFAQGMTLDATCRMMSTDTGVTWEAK